MKTLTEKREEIARRKAKNEAARNDSVAADKKAAELLYERYSDLVLDLHPPNSMVIRVAEPKDGTFLASSRHHLSIEELELKHESGNNREITVQVFRSGTYDRWEVNLWWRGGTGALQLTEFELYDDGLDEMIIEFVEYGTHPNSWWRDRHNAI